MDETAKNVDKTEDEQTEDSNDDLRIIDVGLFEKAQERHHELTMTIVIAIAITIVLLRMIGCSEVMPRH